MRAILLFSIIMLSFFGLAGAQVPAFQKQVGEAEKIHLAMANDLEKAALEFEKWENDSISMRREELLQRAARWLRGAHKIAVDVVIQMERASSDLGGKGADCKAVKDAFQALKQQDDLVLSRISKVLRMMEIDREAEAPAALQNLMECREKRDEKALKLEDAIKDCLAPEPED